MLDGWSVLGRLTGICHDDLHLRIECEVSPHLEGVVLHVGQRGGQCPAAGLLLRVVPDCGHTPDLGDAAAQPHQAVDVPLSVQVHVQATSSLFQPFLGTLWGSEWDNDDLAAGLGEQVDVLLDPGHVVASRKSGKVSQQDQVNKLHAIPSAAAAAAGHQLM